MRYAISFTPPAADRLTVLASRWLGRNAFTRRTIAAAPEGRLSAAEIARHTAVPRRYGFHANLKAPFALAPGVAEADLLRSILRFCGTVEPVTLPALAIGQVGDVFALVPDGPVPGLAAFAERIVREFDPFRASPGEAEIERRRPDRLTHAERANLYRWGSPHVGDEFRFHMTLTGPVEADEADAVRATLADVFRPVLGRPVALDGIALFVEPSPGASFTVHSLHPLGAVPARKSA